MAMKRIRLKTIPKICLYCDKEFFVSSDDQDRKYCSRNCSGLYHRDENNPSWKGNQVGYTALHEWVKRRLPKTELCQNCRAKPPFDLANISQEYKRDFTDWEWLCKSCHAKKDGIGRGGWFEKGHTPWIKGKHLFALDKNPNWKSGISLNSGYQHNYYLKNKKRILERMKLYYARLNYV